MTSPHPTVRVFSLATLPPVESGAVAVGAERRDFFVGDENAVVTAVIESFAQVGLSTEGTPIVFVGGSGLGKTHLAAGLWHLWTQHHPNLRSIYRTGSDFVREFHAAVTARRDDDWRQRFRTASLVIIDGLDEVIARPHATAEMVPLLDELLHRGHRLVVTMRLLPDTTSSIDPRLAARLMAGLVVPLAPPCLATRQHFLESIAPQISGVATVSALSILAEDLPLPLSHLRGAVLRMAERLRIARAPIPTIPELRRLARDEFLAASPALTTVARRVARAFGVTQRDLRGKSRHRHIATARAVAVYLARERTPHTLQEIGMFFGRRDHKTIAHLHNTIAERRTHDASLRQQIDAILADM